MSHSSMKYFKIMVMLSGILIGIENAYSKEKIPAEPVANAINSPSTENTAVNDPAKDAEKQDEKNSDFEQLLEKELDATQKETVNPNRESPNWFYQILKTIIGLAFIIIILYIFRKYLIFKNSFGDVQTGIISLLHEYPVAPGKKLQIIEVGNRLLLIGVSDAGIQLVTEFKEKLPIDQIKLSVESHGKSEKKDFWIELSKGISNKIQDLFNFKNPGKKSQKVDAGNWENLQINARLKIQEMRDKKKFFEDMENTDEKKIL